MDISNADVWLSQPRWPLDPRKVLMLGISSLKMWVRFILMILYAIIYTITGGLLVCRANNEPLCRRSPWLVFISHIANLIEVEFILLTLSIYEADNGSDLGYLRLYQAVMLISHYLFYFPYLLRCYRLYFVFKLGQHWHDTDLPFYELRHRASQNWLIKVLICMMFPVLVASFCLFFIPQLTSIYPATYSPDDPDSVTLMQASTILIAFFRELIFIFAVWKLREVNDDFAMTYELSTVCLLWMTNSFILTPLFPLKTWLYSCIIRNFLIMCVSSIWPIYKSFGKHAIHVPLTIEALRSLDLVLQNEASCEAFSNYLKTGYFELELARLSFKPQSFHQQEGYWLLEFWLECEVFKHNFTSEKAHSIIERYLGRGLLNLPSNIRSSLLDASLLKNPSLFNDAQDYAFKMLSDYYFQLFQRSMPYSFLAAEITRQDIRLNRLASTSFIGR